MVEVLVEYDYIAQRSDELTIKKGDIVKDVIKKNGGWWEGTLHDKKGLFPDNFVKILDKDAVVLRDKKDSTGIRQCRAIFSYDQDHEDELTLKKGDIINIIGEEEEGWWRGVLNGKEGVFPSNFVEEITPAPYRPKPANRDDLRTAEVAPALPAKPVKQQCRVRYSYKAENEDELTIKEGDIITILNKDGQDAGWWKGELNGKVGVFPDNFVVQLTQDDKKTTPTATPTSTLNRIADSSAIVKPSSIASQRKSLELKNAPPKPLEAKTTPPLPSKKPVISNVKKSPSSSGGIFSKLMDKIADAVDGGSASKPKEGPGSGHTADSTTNTTNASAFDHVERRPLLSDVRANRARPPGRRLPTSVYKEDDEEIPGLTNGTSDDTAAINKSTEDIGENLDSSGQEAEGGEAKPRLREWEKHKAPWLEEMKLNQAKRTSVSPDLKTETSKSNQTSPAGEKEPIVEMSKSMSEVRMSPVEVKPIPKPYKTPPNELDKAPPIKSKPVVVPSVNRQSAGSHSTAKEQASLPVKISPKPPKPEPQHHETVIKSSSHVATTNMIGSFTATESSSVITTGSVAASTSTGSSASGSASTTEGGAMHAILERLARLETLCDKQGKMIEELRNRLQVESEMRMLLQEKIVHNNVQV